MRKGVEHSQAPGWLIMREIKACLQVHQAPISVDVENFNRCNILRSSQSARAPGASYYLDHVFGLVPKLSTLQSPEIPFVHRLWTETSGKN